MTTLATTTEGARVHPGGVDVGAGTGFPTVEAVAFAAALLGPTVPTSDDTHRRYGLVVSPGSVRLVTMDPERRVKDDHHSPQRWNLGHDHQLLGGDFSGWSQGNLEEEMGPVQGCTEVMPRTPSQWWSPRSRARMVRVLSTVDWVPVMLAPGTRPAMVTLTYPGDWLAVAPDSATTKRHLDTFGKRLRRLYEHLGLDRPAGVWKLEFQRRGAPHFHLYLPVPVARISWKCGRWCPGHEGRFADWLSSTWASIVGAEGDEGERHRRAGTGLDFAEGSRMSDPKRLAVYFVRHNTKGGKSKAYQHRVPEGWVTPGRWWGTWGLDRVEVEVEVEAQELVTARRLLRRWTEAQHVQGRPRSAPRQVRRGVATSGEVRQRWVTRRYRIAALHHSQGAFVVANDGPALATMLARWLDAERTPPKWGPLDPSRLP